MKTIDEAIRNRPDAFTDRRNYTDPAVFEREMQLIFKKTWVLIGHESEIPNPGDYLCKTISRQPLIQVRGTDHKIRVLFNSCRHRASLVAIEEQGNCAKNHLVCPYHGFEYDSRGNLVKVPIEEGYGPWFKKEEFGLVPIPRVDTYNGMIFGNFDPSAEPLLQFLGPALDYLPYSSSWDGEPIEVVDTYKYDIAGNWKLLVDNTMDGYHVPYVHGSMFEQFGISTQTGISGTARTLGFHGAIDFEEAVSARSGGWQTYRRRRYTTPEYSGI